MKIMHDVSFPEVLSRMHGRRGLKETNQSSCGKRPSKRTLLVHF